MKVIILDTKTGKTHEDNGSVWEYREGDWSCDCNRDPESVYGSFCVGETRFLVVDAEFEDEDEVCQLEDLNEGYPEEMLNLIKYYRSPIRKPPAK